MKQTAVEWLVEEFKEKLTGNNLPNWVLDVIQQAKEMEKEQIIEAWNIRAKIDGVLTYTDNRMAEQYYNETFNKSINNKG
jgi:hypothetical protein